MVLRLVLRDPGSQLRHNGFRVCASGKRVPFKTLESLRAKRNAKKAMISIELSENLDRNLKKIFSLGVGKNIEKSLKSFLNFVSLKYFRAFCTVNFEWFMARLSLKDFWFFSSCWEYQNWFHFDWLIKCWVSYAPSKTPRLINNTWCPPFTPYGNNPPFC